MTDQLRDSLGLKEGESPFPWQEELLVRLRRESIPASIDIPTGLGKTAVMAIWLVARSQGAKLPRRLVYVVDRRAVVDQATTEAERLRQWVELNACVKGALDLTGPLSISTLRGQHVDNRQWLKDPASPAIVVGTIDMVGSRLLFSGYGVSPKMRPYHAGLLGADTLVVLDEAHLVPAFEELLRQIERGAESFGPQDRSLSMLLPSFKFLSLSATGRQTNSTSLTLTNVDRHNPVVSKRLNAKKTLAIVEVAGAPEGDNADQDGQSANAGAEDDAKKKKKKKKRNASKLTRVLAKQAWELTQHGSEKVRCLVYCNARQDAKAVAAELRKLAKSAGATEPTIELFVGARRVLERTMVATWLVQHGFVEREDGMRAEPQGPTFLVATSAGEVGVDMDADHMVCDLTTWERMVQRLGRVNRRGDGDAKVIVVVESEPMPPTAKAKEALAEKIEKRDAAIAAKQRLDELKKKLSAVQDRKTTPPKELKQSAEAKATEEKRKQEKKKLEKSISECEKRIKAFKDADAREVARHEAEVAQHRALRKLLKAVEDDGGSLSPDALVQLRQRRDLADALCAATTTEPLRPELTRAIVDAWSMTSLEEHPGRPEVDPWLRGFRPNDPPQTTVVWRRHLPVRADVAFDAKAAERFFEAAPPHTSEELETETHLVVDWLIDRAAAVSVAQSDKPLPTARQIVAIALTPRGEAKRGWTLEWLSAAKGKGAKDKESRDAMKTREQMEELLTGATLVVDARLGGLVDGVLDDKSNTAAKAADDSPTTWLARADAADVPLTGFRVRQLRSGEQNEVAPPWHTTPNCKWVLRYLFVAEVADGEPSAALAIDGWVDDAPREEANGPQKLGDHQSWAEECAREIAKRLELDKNYEDLLALAARLHDEGKRATRWQRAFKAPIDGRPYAKTKGPIDFDILDGYRHELASLPCVEAHAEFKKLSAVDQEFILHLIAAHHGFARPVIGTSGCDDAPPSIVDERARAVALRFARLSRRWGPWGLAWWEALLRAADQTASRRNQLASAAQEEER